MKYEQLPQRHDHAQNQDRNTYPLVESPGQALLVDMWSPHDKYAQSLGWKHHSVLTLTP